MKTQITKSGLVLIGLTLVLGVLLISYLSLYGPRATQIHNMYLAEEHCIVLRSQVSTDPIFEDITFSVFTDESITVHGTVKHAEDIMGIRTFVEGSEPPSTVQYSIRFYNEEIEMFETYREVFNLGE